MEISSHLRNNRPQGPTAVHEIAGGRRPHSRNKQWVADVGGVKNAAPEGERWERGGPRGGRGRGPSRSGPRFPNASLRVHRPLNGHEGTTSGEDHEGESEGNEEDASYEVEEQEPETPEEREKFYQEVRVALNDEAWDGLPLGSWSKLARSSARKPSQKAKWTIRSFRNA